jgi:glycosyltransferase involved in cell wall biosynthesis
MPQFWNALEFFKENGIITVMDIDDYWVLPQTHPMYHQNKVLGHQDMILKNIKMVDYVTTTTEIFANKIRPHNKNVVVFQNAIDPTEGQYSQEKNPSSRIRFGFVMGSSHEKDMELFNGVVGKLPKEILDKIQIVLCGFDTRGTITMFGKDGSVVQRRPIKPKESVWYRYEQNVTDNYRIVSPEYKMFLERFTPNLQWPNVDDEAYRREWTKDISNFATHYKNVDVLIAPLDETDFNSVKSELKFIEAGFTKTAVIASNFGPYTIGSKNMFLYGGEVDNTGNCILIDKRKAHKDFVKAIKKLVENPELITTLQNNMYETVKEKYDIRNVTDRRAAWYKEIVQPKKENA